MIRRWQADASAHIVIEGTTYPVVTAEDMARALSKLAVVVDAVGGYGTLATQRIPTGFPDESVTTQAVVTFMPFTDARRKPEPDARDAEQPTSLSEQDAEALAATVNGEDGGGVLPFGEDAEAVAAVAENGGLVDYVGDGLFVDPDAPAADEDEAGVRA